MGSSCLLKGQIGHTRQEHRNLPSSKWMPSERRCKVLRQRQTACTPPFRSSRMQQRRAVEREEKLKDKIHSIQQKYKAAEGRFEYGEMNITKLNQRIDDIEDEIYREKLKIKKCADELGETFNDMLAHY